MIMTATPIQIRKDDVVRDIRELAELKRRPITEVVAMAVRAELERTRRVDNIEERRRRVDEIVERFNSLPVIGPELTDEDLYDEDGMPR